MNKLNDKLMQEIVDNTNHKDIKSVKNALYYGDIEIYDSKKDYEDDGFDIYNEDYCLMLSDGRIAHFIG
jgi:hypothetical protein